jgi:hypothetical protein
MSLYRRLGSSQRLFELRRGGHFTCRSAPWPARGPCATAAGYLWLVAAWVVLEPVVPVRAEASGVVGSLYRASDVLSVLGLGIALSFAAYILGSISSSALTPLLRRFFPVHGRTHRDFRLLRHALLYPHKQEPP